LAVVCWKTAHIEIGHTIQVLCFETPLAIAKSPTINQEVITDPQQFGFNDA
jgi:hypothetical protein